MNLSNMTLDEIIQVKQAKQETEKEDYAAGCYKENYMVPNVCPVATGNWCRDYVKCKSLVNDLTEGT